MYTNLIKIFSFFLLFSNYIFLVIINSLFPTSHNLIKILFSIYFIASPTCFHLSYLLQSRFMSDMINSLRRGTCLSSLFTKILTSNFNLAINLARRQFTCPDFALLKKSKQFRQLKCYYCSQTRHGCFGKQFLKKQVNFFYFSTKM